MVEPPIQLADVNTQTTVPELPANLTVSSPVNLPDVGDPMPDSQPVQTTSDGMVCIQSCPKYYKLSYLCWLDVQVISLVKSVYLRVWTKRHPYPHCITIKKIWNIWIVQWKHSYLTFLFAGKHLALTKTRYCDFNAALTFSLMDEKCYM